MRSQITDGSSPVFITQRIFHACPLQVIGYNNICASESIYCFSLGILCGTLAAKKKKKMMYLTAKNAGQKIPFVLDSELDNFFLLLILKCL